MSRYVRPSGDAPEYTDALKAQVERLTAELADYRKALEVRNKQLGVACMKHDLVHSLACGICLTETRECAYLAGQASVEERVKELEQERDEAVRQWERFERMAGDNWAALKAQAGEPPRVDTNWVNIKMDVSHPTTERPYNPLNDYAVISMNPTTERRVPEDVRQVMEMVLREVEAVANDHHHPRYTRLDEAITALRNALNAAPKGEV